MTSAVGELRRFAGPSREGVQVGVLGLAWRPRILGTTTALLVAVVVVGVVAAGVGQAWLGPARVVSVLLGGGDPGDRLILLELRMPRVAGGLLVGFALGVAGALAQTFTRNPLATPDIIGVQSGAAAGAVAAIILGGGTYSVSAGLTSLGVPTAALLGGIVAAAVVYGLSWRGGVQGFRLVLIGIGVSAALTACTSYLLVIALVSDAGEASAWLVGSLSSVDWTRVAPLAVAVLVATPLALATSRGLALDVLGDDVARGLGVRLDAHRLLVLGTSVVLAASATAAAGPVAFVAFVCPQVAQRLAGAERPPLLAAGLAGAALVTAADTLGRTLTSWEIPVGLVTVAIGAPYLLWLLVARRGEAAG